MQPKEPQKGVKVLGASQWIAQVSRKTQVQAPRPHPTAAATGAERQQGGPEPPGNYPWQPKHTPKRFNIRHDPRRDLDERIEAAELSQSRRKPPPLEPPHQQQNQPRHVPPIHAEKVQWVPGRVDQDRQNPLKDTRIDQHKLAATEWINGFVEQLNPKRLGHGTQSRAGRAGCQGNPRPKSQPSDRSCPTQPWKHP